MHTFAAPLLFAKIGIPPTSACPGKPGQAAKSISRPTSDVGPRMMSGWGGGGSSAARGEKGRRAGGSGGGGKRQFDEGE